MGNIDILEKLEEYSKAGAEIKNNIFKTKSIKLHYSSE